MQATNNDQLFGHDNRFVVGASFDSSVTRFTASAELGTIGYELCRHRQRRIPRAIRAIRYRSVRSRFAPPTSITGLYALDTFDVTNRFSVTGGRAVQCRAYHAGGPDRHRAQWQSTFNRFNPIIGGTYKITSGCDRLCRLFRSQPRADAAGTRLRRSGEPCIIAAFLVSDPPLKQVVSRTVEAGFRGTKELNIGTLGWKLGGFRATNTDDILAIPSPVLQGFGYFQNVGSDPPPGHRGRGQSASRRRCSSTPATPSWTRASSMRCRSAPTARLPMPTAMSRFCRATKFRPSRATASRPASIIRSPTRSKSAAMRCLSASQYFVGDESNQAPRLPSYAVFNVHASYQINKTFQIYGRVDNIFDNRYATYGTFFDTGAVPNFANGGAPFTDPRSVSPARPRAFYAGLRRRSKAGGNVTIRYDRVQWT